MVEKQSKQVKSKKKFSAKGYFFSIDALIALIIMVSVLLIFSSFYQNTAPDVQHTYYSSDMAELLSSVKLKDIDTSVLQSVLNTSNLTDYNLTVLEQIGRYWAVGETDTAEALAQEVLGSLIPPQFGYAIIAEDQVIYSNNKSLLSQLFSAKQIISGLEQGNVVLGQSARVFLTGINAKSDTAYIYFGGYEGDGNLSKVVFLPSDAYNIEDVTIELDSAQNFELWVNGNYSGVYNISNQTNRADTWTVDSQYHPLWKPNQNNISLYFTDPSNNYVGGGFIKATFSTSEIQDTQIVYSGNNTATEKYHFPGIDGIINLFSSYYVPGNLTSMEIYLHYFANHSNAFNSPLVLKIGNDSVYADSTSTDIVMATLDDSDFSELNYSALSLETIPIAFGFENLTDQEIVVGGFRGDSVLITDVSGSMDTCDIDKTGYSQLTCPGNLGDPEAERLETAKFVDKDFIERILNTSGNRIGLVSYESALSDFHNLTDQEGILDNEVDNYVADGGTCISCGIHQAAQVLIADNRKPIHGSLWKYSVDYQFSSPPTNWENISYNDSSWPEGVTTLGFGGVTTEIINATHVDLWEMAADAPQPVDFGSGMNSTDNTFGLISLDVITSPLSNMHFDGPSQSSWTEKGDGLLVSDVSNPTSVFSESWESYYGTGSHRIYNTELDTAPGYWETDGEPWWDKEVYIMANQGSYPAYAGSDVFMLRDMDAYGSTETEIDVSSYSWINLSYYWRLGSTSFESGEYGNVRVSTNGGSDWTTVAIYDTDDDDDTYHYDEIDLSNFSMTSNFRIRFGCRSSNNDERCYYDDINVTGYTSYFGMRDFYTIDSDESLSGSLNQDFTIPEGVINWAYLRFNHSIHDSLFDGTANLYCNLTHPSGNTVVWSDTYPTLPSNGAIQEDILITSYLTSTGFTYNIECGATVTSGGGRTIVAFDDIVVDINYTSVGNDGWDWARGNDTYGTNGDDGAPGDYDMTSHADPSGLSDGTPQDGSDRLEIDIGGTQCGSSCGYMDSGAFGIQINITPEIYSMVQAGGSAIVSFDYEAFDRECIQGGADDTEESVWIKARFGNSDGMNYLGYDLDTGEGAPTTSPEDNTLEILYDYSSTDDNCWHANQVRGDYNLDGDNDYNGGTFTQDVSAYITRADNYYFDFGAKFDSSGGWQGTTEGIVAYFDNIDFTVYNQSGDFYFRNQFTLDDLGSLNDPELFVYSDDGVDVYINGNLILSDPGPHNATYWNTASYPIGINNLTVGPNLIAVKLHNDDAASAKFDLELRANVSNLAKAMVIMSDGDANYCHGPDDGGMDTNGWSGDCIDSQAINETISFACYAHNTYGISIYTVAFGQGADQSTLNQTACCDDCGNFYTSENVSGLVEVYRDIAENLIAIEVEEFNQTINISGQFVQSILFNDSYIEYTYEATEPDVTFGRIPVDVESPTFGNEVTIGSIEIDPKVTVERFALTSYSGNRWTDKLLLDNILYNDLTIFNLSEYNQEYKLIGDPFIIEVPKGNIQSGTNTVTIGTGTAGNVSTNGSVDNRALYTIGIDAQVNYTGVFPQAEGCIWAIDFEDGTSANITVPANYTGSNQCDFATDTYDTNDAIDQAVYQLLTLLDLDGDKEIVVSIDKDDIDTKIISLGGIPFLWGPITMEVRVWS